MPEVLVLLREYPIALVNRPGFYRVSRNPGAIHLRSSRAPTVSDLVSLASTVIDSGPSQFV